MIPMLYQLSYLAIWSVVGSRTLAAATLGLSALAEAVRLELTSRY